MSSDNDIKAWQQKLRDQEKQNDDIQNRLAKKEHECQIIAEEKVGQLYWNVKLTLMLNSTLTICIKIS